MFWADQILDRSQSLQYTLLSSPLQNKTCKLASCSFAQKWLSFNWRGRELPPTARPQWSGKCLLMTQNVPGWTSVQVLHRRTGSPLDLNIDIYAFKSESLLIFLPLPDLHLHVSPSVAPRVLHHPPSPLFPLRKCVCVCIFNREGSCHRLLWPWQKLSHLRTVVSTKTAYSNPHLESLASRHLTFWDSNHYVCGEVKALVSRPLA